MKMRASFEFCATGIGDLGFDLKARHFHLSVIETWNNSEN